MPFSTEVACSRQDRRCTSILAECPSAQRKSDFALSVSPSSLQQAAKLSITAPIWQFAANRACSFSAYSRSAAASASGRRPFLLCYGACMDLHVELDGDEIVVTRPRKDFLLAYRKRPDSPNLVLTRSWMSPTVSSPEISEFRAHAFQAAVSKARELGWIV